jgi:hypothetical protein
MNLSLEVTNGAVLVAVVLDLVHECGDLLLLGLYFDDSKVI